MYNCEKICDFRSNPEIIIIWDYFVTNVLRNDVAQYYKQGQIE